MSTSPRFHSPLILVCLLICGSAVLAQEQVESTSPAAAEHGDAHVTDGFELSREDPYLSHRQRESFLGWMIRCMGPIGLLIPVAGLFCFVLTLVVVLRGQGPFAAAALVFLVPIPFWLGLFGTVQGLILSLQVIATSTTAPRPSELSDGIATALFNPMLGLVAMTPSYLLATLGAIFRCIATPAIKS